MGTFASDEEINAAAIAVPLTSKLVTAYRDKTETDDVPKAALEFFDAVDKMLGLNYDSDRDSVISDLRWLASIFETAADNIENHT